MFPETTKILVVDDMMTMRKLVKRACQTMGYATFVEAEDGKKAWEALQANEDIGLVISDWNMPNVSGLEFLKKARADARFKELPFVLLTAEAEATQVSEAIQCGVSNYVVKPFTPAGLKTKLEAVYHKHFGKAA